MQPEKVHVVENTFDKPVRIFFFSNKLHIFVVLVCGNIQANTLRVD